MSASQDRRIARIMAANGGVMPARVVRPSLYWRDSKRQPNRPKSIAWAFARDRNRQTDHSANRRRDRLAAVHRIATRARRACAHASQRRNRRRS